MKDSGIPWVGEIPEDWCVEPLRQFFTERKHKNADGAEDNLLSLSYGRIIRKDIDSSDGLLPANFLGYNIVESGDIVFRMTDLQNDKKSLRSGLVGERGIITSAYVTVAPKCGVESRFHSYLQRAYDQLKVYYNMGSGVRQGINYDDLKRMPVLAPPLDEQQRIADYLDARCDEIDEVKQTLSDEIDALQRLRKATIHKAVTKGLDESVPMKDSGVEWIGEMPNSWKSRKVKYMFEIVKRIAGREGFDVLAITQQGIRVKDITISEGQQLAKDYSGYQFVYPGDFAMNHMDLITGWVDCSKQFGVTSPDYRVFRPMRKRPINREYYKYVFQNCYSNRVFYHLGNGVSGQGRWRLQAPAFNHFVVPIPPLDEQRRIADYLDERCDAIDSVIKTRTKQLERLEDYRKALVFAYVTGKKEVPVHEQ